MKIIIGYIFAFYATKMGSKDSGETKVDLIGSRGVDVGATYSGGTYS